MFSIEKYCVFYKEKASQWFIEKCVYFKRDHFQGKRENIMRFYFYFESIYTIKRQELYTLLGMYRVIKMEDC